MAWLYLLRLVVKNVGRNRLRTGLTMVGIAVAIISYGMLRRRRTKLGGAADYPQ